jgi:hypothetical protein
MNEKRDFMVESDFGREKRLGTVFHGGYFPRKHAKKMFQQSIK